MIAVPVTTCPLQMRSNSRFDLLMRLDSTMFIVYLCIEHMSAISGLLHVANYVMCAIEVILKGRYSFYSLLISFLLGCTLQIFYEEAEFA